MKKVILGGTLALLCLTGCKKETETNTVTKTDTIVITETDTVPKPVDTAEVNRAWAEYMAPGEMHKLLAEETGTWDVTMTFWEGPDAKAETASATANVNMVLGGRYQEAIYNGNMMGMDWQGKSTVSYNNKTGMFTSTFIDNTGTGMMVAKGHYDEGVKAIISTGEMADVVTGKPVKFREVYTFVDGKTRKMETFDKKDGLKEYKSLEIVMKRR
ncbi:DUF1579 family protein [Flavobacterium sp. RHBU_24]|uniref:DUF1579 domain-containing protein n=1 Tax=Flavobacterium sp. RHBU_24 TaxID=3391185 RepID=UPI0039855015